MHAALGICGTEAPQRIGSRIALNYDVELAWRPALSSTPIVDGFLPLPRLLSNRTARRSSRPSGLAFGSDESAKLALLF